MWRDMLEDSACHKGFLPFVLVAKYTKNAFKSFLDTYISFNDNKIWFYKKIKYKSSNSCAHDGTLWIAVMKFPSDWTSRLLQEEKK